MQPFFPHNFMLLCCCCVLVYPPAPPVSAATNRGGKQVPCETLTASHRRDQLHARVHTALKISEPPLRVLPKGGNYGAPQAHAQDPIPEDDLGTPQQSTNWGGEGGGMPAIAPRG